MLESGMRVKIAGLVKGAQYNGLEATVQELLCGTDKRARRQSCPDAGVKALSQMYEAVQSLRTSVVEQSIFLR